MRRFASLLFAVVFTACSVPVEEKVTDAAPTETTAPAEDTAAAAPRDRSGSPRFRRVARMARKPGAGKLKLVYGKASRERKEVIDVFRQERLFEDVVDELNRGLVLRHDITVRLQDCGEVNAYYDPNSRTINLCYELFDDLLTSFTDEEVSEEEDESGAKAVAALVFVFYHELGHALIDVYDLPVTGREEDAVDQLATVLLLESWEGEDSELAILSSAEWFGVGETEGTDEEMADEHSLSEQRYYNLVCWIYGSDPEYFSEVADDWGLPPARAEQCSSEYARMSSAWNTLLGPHMRPAS